MYYDILLMQVVMVTGAAGFLGQHIIRELQENAPEVSRIVALDRLPYLKQFGERLFDFIPNSCDLKKIFMQIMQIE